MQDVRHNTHRYTTFQIRLVLLWSYSTGLLEMKTGKSGFKLQPASIHRCTCSLTPPGGGGGVGSYKKRTTVHLKLPLSSRLVVECNLFTLQLYQLKRKKYLHNFGFPTQHTQHSTAATTCKSHRRGSTKFKQYYNTIKILCKSWNGVFGEWLRQQWRRPVSASPQEKQRWVIHIALWLTSTAAKKHLKTYRNSITETRIYRNCLIFSSIANTVSLPWFINLFESSEKFVWKIVDFCIIGIPAPI